MKHVDGLRRALLAHYDRAARDLPWRGETDPYRVLVSEVMLQQTRVEVVVPYYEAFLDRFPDVESLAASPVDDVLALWSGLGYYRRARQLHRAARQIVEEGGEFPATARELEKLPGIGPYTSAAIASTRRGAKLSVRSFRACCNEVSRRALLACSVKFSVPRCMRLPFCSLPAG